jgi:hypothetical protein
MTELVDSICVLFLQLHGVYLHNMRMLLPYVLFEFCFKLLGLWLTDISFV